MDKPVSVITGGCGFLGSHLTDLLLSQGQQVIAVDNLITGNKNNIAHLDDNPDFKFVHQDLSSGIEIAGRVDYVYNLASPASPFDYLEYPIQTMKVGALGTHNALGLAKEKSARFLMASTSEIYGDPLIHPQPESYWGNVNTIGPRGCYDEAKRFSEAMTMAYHRFHSLETRLIRIFNTYGPRMRPKDGRVVPTFIMQALKNEPISVFGDGSQTRSFCFVADLIRGMNLLMESNCSEPVNIGNPVEMTVLQFAEEIIEMCGSQSEIKFLPLPEDDPKVRQPVIDRAKERLDWKPEVDLKTGLRPTIEYFKMLIETGNIC